MFSVVFGLSVCSLWGKGAHVAITHGVLDHQYKLSYTILFSLPASNLAAHRGIFFVCGTRSSHTWMLFKIVHKSLNWQGHSPQTGSTWILLFRRFLCTGTLSTGTPLYRHPLCTGTPLYRHTLCTGTPLYRHPLCTGTPSVQAPPLYRHTLCTDTLCTGTPLYRHPLYRQTLCTGTPLYRHPLYRYPLYRHPSVQAPLCTDTLCTGTPLYRHPSVQTPSVQAPLCTGTHLYRHPSVQGPLVPLWSRYGWQAGSWFPTVMFSC